VYVGFSPVNMRRLTCRRCYGTDAQSIVKLCGPACRLKIL
jgi:hypothetical protein